MKFVKKAREAVGLDIGTYAIKVVSMETGGEKNILTGYNLKRIPFDAKPEQTINYVKEILDEIDLTPEEVNLGFSGPSVIVRFIELPRMSKENLVSALNFEAEKHIPFNINEVVMDSIILGDASDPGKMNVLLAVAKRDLVNSRIKLMSELGVSIQVLDVDIFSVFNSFGASNETQDKGNAFFHFGHSQTDLLISVGQKPSFVRQVQIGGKDIGKSIAKHMELSLEKAEELKLHADDANKAKVEEATIPVLDDLIKEMQLSFGYFENRYNAEVSHVYCSGGMIYQPGIMDYFIKRSGVKVEVWNPVKGLDLAEHLSREDISKVGSQLAVSIGLALRG